MKLKAILLTIVMVLAISHTVMAETTEKVFEDLDESHWAYSFVMWAYEEGVVVGYPDGTFKPNNQLKENEFLSMLINAYNPEDLSPQQEGETWFDRYYNFAQERNWHLKGFEDEAYKKDTMTRGSVAILLANASGVETTDEIVAIEYLLETGLSQGKTEATVEGYMKDDYLTRAEAVTFVKVFTTHFDELYYQPEQSEPVNELEAFETQLIEVSMDKGLTLDYVEDRNLYHVNDDTLGESERPEVFVAEPNEHRYASVTIYGEKEDWKMQFLLDFVNSFGFEEGDEFIDKVLNAPTDEWANIQNDKWRITYRMVGGETLLINVNSR